MSDFRLIITKKNTYLARGKKDKKENTREIINIFDFSKTLFLLFLPNYFLNRFNKENYFFRKALPGLHLLYSDLLHLHSPFAVQPLLYSLLEGRLGFASDAIFFARRCQSHFWGMFSFFCCFTIWGFFYLFGW